ncbi:MAG: cytochrome C [Bacteroidetes bacterium HGW-Bacteroidetes-3]|jgi:cytochrome c|nr:MAG: cytochrome C [Bacteroidetes bacterium HGW-Bacteroidetes-3]
MKKSILILGLITFFFVSCGESKKEEVKKEVETPAEPAKEQIKSSNDYLVLGQKLFTEKTCVTCHQPDVKVIGPSLKDINRIYTEKNGNIVAFLKGEAPAIVDTDPGQVAIMKANIDGFVKNLSNEEKAALAVYINSIK